MMTVHAERRLTVAVAGVELELPVLLAPPAALGVASSNLDSWAMPPPLLDSLAARAAESAEILVIEGVMGLFDGAPGGAPGNGATAELVIQPFCPRVSGTIACHYGPHVIEGKPTTAQGHLRPEHRKRRS